MYGRSAWPDDALTLQEVTHPGEGIGELGRQAYEVSQGKVQQVAAFAGHGRTESFLLALPGADERDGLQEVDTAQAVLQATLDAAEDRVLGGQLLLDLPPDFGELVVITGLLHVVPVTGVRRGEQLEDVQGDAPRVDPLEHRTDRVHGGGGGQSDHGHLEGAHLLENRLVELAPQVPVPVLVRLDVRPLPLIDTLGVEDEVEGKEAYRALGLGAAQVQHDCPVEVRSEHLVGRDRHDGLVTIGGGPHCLRDVDVVPALDGFAPGVRRFHRRVQPQGLEERGKALLPVQQQEVGLRVPVRLGTGEGPGAEPSGAAGLQRHDDAERVVQCDRRDDRPDPVVVPLPVTLEVGQL